MHRVLGIILGASLSCGALGQGSTASLLPGNPVRAGFDVTFGDPGVEGMPIMVFSSQDGSVAPVSGLGVVLLPNPGSSLPANYVTGGGSSSLVPKGSAADLRNRGFSGGAYFSSSAQGVDSSFALRLGNGVKPGSALSFGGVNVVPEPSTLALCIVGFGSLVFYRRRGC
jgi:hypothetical protein